jgi:hypothetical protein
LSEFQQSGGLFLSGVNKRDELCGYDMILGRDFLREIKLDILFSEDVLRWNDMDIRMKPSEECAKEASAIAYSGVFASNYGRRYEYEGEDDPLEGEILRLKDLADARYKPPDIDDYVETMDHLDDDEKLKVKALLVKQTQQTSSHRNNGWTAALNSDKQSHSMQRLQTTKVSVRISSLDTQWKDPRSVPSRMVLERRTEMAKIHEIPWVVPSAVAVAFRSIRSSLSSS